MPRIGALSPGGSIGRNGADAVERLEGVLRREPGPRLRSRAEFALRRNRTIGLRRRASEVFVLKFSPPMKLVTIMS